ncbi:hypothetical protein D3C76_851090 [compost metagenome]
MVDRLALVGEARSAVRHQALALGGADLLAQVGLAGLAELALAALRGIQGDHMIAHRHRGDARAYRLDNAAALMAEDAREHTFRVGARQGVGIGMADTGGEDAHQDFAFLRRSHIDLDDFQRFVGSKGDSGTGLDHLETPERGVLRRPPQRTRISGSADRNRATGCARRSCRRIQARIFTEESTLTLKV